MKTKTLAKLLLSFTLATGVAASTVIFTTTEATAKVTKKKKKKSHGRSSSAAAKGDPFVGIYACSSDGGNAWTTVEMNLRQKKKYYGNSEMTYGVIENRTPGVTDDYDIVDVFTMSGNEAEVKVTKLGAWQPEDAFLVTLKYNPAKGTLTLKEQADDDAGSYFPKPVVMKRRK